MFYVVEFYKMASYDRRPAISLNNSLGMPSYSPWALGSFGVGSASTTPSADPLSHYVTLGRNAPFAINPTDTVIVQFDSYMENYNPVDYNFTLTNGHWRIDIEAEFTAGGGGSNFTKPEFFVRQPPPGIIYTKPMANDTVTSGTKYFITATTYLSNFFTVGVEPAPKYEIRVRNNGASPATISIQKIRVHCTRISTALI